MGGCHQPGEHGGHHRPDDRQVRQRLLQDPGAVQGQDAAHVQGRQGGHQAASSGQEPRCPPRPGRNVRQVQGRLPGALRLRRRLEALRELQGRGRFRGHVPLRALPVRALHLRYARAFRLQRLHRQAPLDGRALDARSVPGGRRRAQLRRWLDGGSGPGDVRLDVRGTSQLAEERGLRRHQHRRDEPREHAHSHPRPEGAPAREVLQGLQGDLGQPSRAAVRVLQAEHGDARAGDQGRASRTRTPALHPAKPQLQRLRVSHRRREGHREGDTQHGDTDLGRARQDRRGVQGHRRRFARSVRERRFLPCFSLQPQGERRRHRARGQRPDPRHRDRRPLRHRRHPRLRPQDAHRRAARSQRVPQRRRHVREDQQIREPGERHR